LPVGGAFEDLLPAFVDGGAVVQILLVQLVFEPAIDTQVRIGFQGHSAGRPSYPSYGRARREAALSVAGTANAGAVSGYRDCHTPNIGAGSSRQGLTTWLLVASP
jgi:hypothetical protein